MLTMLAWMAVAGAQDRVAVGVGVGGGISPFEPVFGTASGPVGTVTLDVEAWAITGGEDRVGKRGRTHRTPDHRRLGAVCAGGFNQGRVLRSPAQQGGCGFAFGGQWGGTGYLTAWTAVGLGAYTLLDLPPGGREQQYTSFGPWIRPKIALALAPAFGLAFEVGPYASIVVPLSTTFHNAIPNGRYVGQVGLELTTLIGSTTPKR